MNPLIQLKIATLLFLFVALASIGSSTPSPSPCHERLFKFCETCRNPAYGPEWGETYACSWTDLVQRLNHSGRCRIRPSASPDDCIHP